MNAFYDQRRPRRVVDRQVSIQIPRRTVVRREEEVGYEHYF